MNSRNFIVLDIETTGLDPDKCDIVQVSAKAINANNLQDHHAGHRTWLIKPTNPDAAEEGALRVIGKDLFERAKAEGLDLKVALADIVKWANSVNDTGKQGTAPYFVGHNAKFDWEWLRTTMLRHGIAKDKSALDKLWPFHVNFIDTVTLMFALFESSPQVNNYKLDTLLEVLGERRATANHDAREDVELTARAFVRFMRGFRTMFKRMVIKKS